MARVVEVRVVWHGEALPLCPAVFRDIHIGPEPGYPFGRKGLALAGAWRQLGDGADGMLILDGDVAIDPADLLTMRRAIDAEPGAVHTAPARIWPKSARRPDWTWAHWSEAGPSQQLEVDGVRWFSFCFTYLPRYLLTSLCRSGLAGWQFPCVDGSVSRRAQRLGVPVRVVADCWPVHLHY